MSYVVWKRGLPRKCACFVLCRPIKTRSFNFWCVLDLFSEHWQLTLFQIIFFLNRRSARAHQFHSVDQGSGHSGLPWRVACELVSLIGSHPLSGEDGQPTQTSLGERLLNEMEKAFFFFSDEKPMKRVAEGRWRQWDKRNRKQDTRPSPSLAVTNAPRVRNHWIIRLQCPINHEGYIGAKF